MNTVDDPLVGSPMFYRRQHDGSITDLSALLHPSFIDPNHTMFPGISDSTPLWTSPSQRSEHCHPSTPSPSALSGHEQAIQTPALVLSTQMCNAVQIDMGSSTESTTAPPQVSRHSLITTSSGHLSANTTTGGKDISWVESTTGGSTCDYSQALSPFPDGQSTPVSVNSTLIDTPFMACTAGYVSPLLTQAQLVDLTRRRHSADSRLDLAQHYYSTAMSPSTLPPPPSTHTSHAASLSVLVTPFGTPEAHMISHRPSMASISIAPHSFSEITCFKVAESAQLTWQQSSQGKADHSTTQPVQPFLPTMYTPFMPPKRYDESLHKKRTISDSFMTKELDMLHTVDQSTAVGPDNKATPRSQDGLAKKRSRTSLSIPSPTLSKDPLVEKPVLFHKPKSYQGSPANTSDHRSRDTNDDSDTGTPPPSMGSPLHPDQSHPQAMPRRQKLRYEGDAYTPKWVRYTGQLKEGYCDSCQPGKWLQLKNSAYWYHKQFFHGISSVSGKRFMDPLEQRIGPHDTIEGLCHQCRQYVTICNNKRKNNHVLWYRHAHKCHIYDKAKSSNYSSKKSTSKQK